jgi:hypothetical protein
LATRGKILALAAVVAAGVALSAAASSPAPLAPCKSSFAVLHNDRVGALAIPKGQYYMTPVGLDCAAASEL